MEKQRRANKFFARAKQFGIWTAALVFSYIDLGTTAVVGREYLNIGTAEGTRAAHAMFGMLGMSLGFQTLFAYATGKQLHLLRPEMIKTLVCSNGIQIIQHVCVF